MPKFIFNLEPVLEMRQRAEEEKQRAVALIERERLHAEDRLRAFQQSIQSTLAEQRAMLAAGGAVPVHGLRLQAGAAMAAHAQAGRLALELAGILKRLDAARADLLRAAAARKAVELLRERRLEEWKLEQGRRDARELDEIASGLRQRAIREAEPAT